MTAQGETTARGPLTLLRGWALAVVATVPAAALHGGVDGHTPSALSLLVATTLAAAICVPLVGKKFTRVRSGAAILASQALFHTFFTLAGAGAVQGVAQGAANGAVQVTAGGAGAHAHHGAHGMHGQLEIAVSGSAHEVSGWMVAAHVVAAAITVGMVWYGEALLRGILRAVGAVVTNLSALASVVRATFAPPQRPRIFIAGREPRLIASRVADLLQGRGPPVCA